MLTLIQNATERPMAGITVHLQHEPLCRLAAASRAGGSNITLAPTELTEGAHRVLKRSCEEPRRRKAACKCAVTCLLNRVPI